MEYVIKTEPSLWHGRGKKGSNHGGAHGWPYGRPLVGYADSASERAWKRIADALISAYRQPGQKRGSGWCLTQQLQKLFETDGRLDRCAANVLWWAHHVAEPLPGMRWNGYFDLHLAREHRGWPITVDAAIQAFEEFEPFLRLLSQHRQYWHIDGRPVLDFWACWETGQREACELARQRGWFVVADVMGAWPNEQIPFKAQEWRGAADAVTGFTCATVMTPEPGRYGLRETVARQNRNILAWRRAGHLAIPALSPAFDNTPVRGEGASLQVLYRDRAELVEAIESVVAIAPEIEGELVFAYNTLDCRLEGTPIEPAKGLRRQIMPLAADGLPNHLGDPGSLHLDALREAMA